MSDDYKPAKRPPNAPGGDRVRFEREGDYEQSIFGGGAQDIEAAIMDSTKRNLEMMGWRIMTITDTRGDMGAGTLQEIVMNLEGPNGGKKVMTISGIGLEVKFG